MRIRKTVAAVAIAFASLAMAPTTANASDIVPCGSDLDCFEKNPTVRGGYGTEKFFDDNLIIVNGHAIRIEEDDPRWNCQTMGNHICGEYDPVNGKWMLNVFSTEYPHEYLYSTPLDDSIQYDIDGRVMIPFDYNGDGIISGDIENGS